MSFYPYPYAYPYNFGYPPYFQERKHRKRHKNETEERLRKKVDKKRRELQEQDETIHKLMYMPTSMNSMPIDMNAQMENNTSMLMNKMNEINANFLALQNSILHFDERLKSLEANFALNKSYEDRMAFLENNMNGNQSQCDEQRVVRLENDLKESNQIISQIVSILKGMKNESEQREMMTIKLIKETEAKTVAKILNILQNSENKEDFETLKTQSNAIVENEIENAIVENEIENEDEEDLSEILKNPSKAWQMLLALQKDYQELSMKYKEIISTADMNDPEIKSKAEQIERYVNQLKQTSMLLFEKLRLSNSEEIENTQLEAFEESMQKEETEMNEKEITETEIVKEEQEQEQEENNNDEEKYETKE